MDASADATIVFVELAKKLKLLAMTLRAEVATATLTNIHSHAPHQVAENPANHVCVCV